MGKNKGKGGKNRRRGKNDSEGEKRELVIKQEGQEYGFVSKMLGNNTVEVQCYDGLKRFCHIRGKLRKKVWINMGDTVLVSLRDFQNERGDIILKYHPDEARQLKLQGELPENAKINEVDFNYNDSGIEDDIEFQESDGVNIEDI